MKRLVLAVLMVCSCVPAFGQDATTAWRNVLKKCAKSDLIGKQSLFFGVSNLIGPGSIWRRANDNSIRLVSVLSDAVPSASDQALIVKSNNTAVCVGNSSTQWNLKLGLPFTTGATPLTLNIAGLLGGAHNVTVSVKGYAIDTLDEGQWKQAFSKLGSGNVFYQDTQQPDRLLAENAVKVTGLTAVFNFKSDLSADVQAQYKGTTFTLGNSSSSTASGASTSGTSAATTVMSSSGTAGTVTTAASTSPIVAPGAAGSSSGSSCAAAPSGGTPSTGTPGTSAANGVATFHVDVTSSRQVTICVDGPFYLIAAYSSIVGGTPMGVAPTQGGIQLVDNVTLPTNATAKSERKP